MPKKKELTQEQQQMKDVCKEIEIGLTQTLVPALMSRDDIVAVTVPEQLNIRAPRGALLIVFSDGSQAMARFTVDTLFEV